MVGHGVKGGILIAGCRVEDKYHAFGGRCIRPIRTPEQRQRDELIKIIKEADEMAYSFRPDDLADAILSKYNLTEK